MFRKKDKNQGIPDGVVGNNLKNARLTKKEREEIATTERKRIRKQMEAEAERYQIIKSTQRIIPVEDMWKCSARMNRTIFASHRTVSSISVR